MDNATVPWGDKRTERGNASEECCRSDRSNFDITTSWYASPDRIFSQVAAEDDCLAIGPWSNNIHFGSLADWRVIPLSRIDLSQHHRAGHGSIFNHVETTENG